MDCEDQNRRVRTPAARKSWRLARYLGVMLLCGVGVGWLGALGCASSRKEADLDLVTQAYRSIQNHYVDQSAVQSKELTYGAISGMVEALGDTGHSTFLTPEMVKELKSMERGELKGIGIEIEMKNGQVVIVAPIDGSPAQRAGLRSGEVILKIGTQDVGDWPLNKVVDAILGPTGTAVSLTLQEPHNGRTRQVTLKRAAIKLHEVTWQRLPETQIAHVRIATFDAGVTKDFRRALQSMHGAGVKGIILDLRNDPGGLLDEAIGVASQFLTNGDIVLTKDASGKISAEPALDGGLASDLPTVVLINQGSASAAEIVAGALQDRGRAPLVGETSFGTGTVLQEFGLSDGSALLLAVGEWLTPNGHSFWHKGVVPQYEVPLPAEVSPLVPANEAGLTPKELMASDDRQLLTALRLLNNHGQIDQLGTVQNSKRHRTE